MTTPLKNRVLLLPFLVGFWSLAGQFVFNRIIFFYLANSEHAAASIISLHLLGFLVGSMAVKQRRVSLGALVLVSLLLTPLAQLTVWTLGVHVLGLWPTLWLTLAFAFLLALTSGALVVRLIEVLTFAPTAVLIADTVGSVFGAILGGFVLVPHFGLSVSFASIMALQGLALFILDGAEKKRRWLFAVPAVIFLALALNGSFLARTSETLKVEGFPISETSPRSRLLFEKKSAFGVLSVIDDGDARALRIDNRHLCILRHGEDVRKKSQWLAGEVAAVVAGKGIGAPSHPRLALVGLGCGSTLAALLSHIPPAPALVDVIDINPEIQKAQKYFREFLPYHPDDPRVRPFARDGFVHFTQTPDARLYDAVLVDVVWMQNMNATHLFSAEMFQNVRRWLTPRGLFVLWTEEVNPFSPTSQIIYRTLRSVFPFVRVDTSRDQVLYFASLNYRPELESVLMEDPKVSSWIEAVSQQVPINRLDNLVLNRVRFNEWGEKPEEQFAQRYEKLREFKKTSGP